MKKTRRKKHISSKTYHMYHTMKNILGASLVILAIVIAQIPMGDVAATEESGSGNYTVTFNTLIDPLNEKLKEDGKYEVKTNSAGYVDEPGIESYLTENVYTYTYKDENNTEITTKYTFAGWYKNKFEDKVDFNIKESITSDTTYYAKWTTGESKTFKVSFNCNGASNSSDSSFDTQEISTNSSSPLLSATKPNVTPQKTGSTFKGWFEYLKGSDGNATLTEYDWERGVTHNVILFAVYDNTNMKTITFDYNGGKDTSGNVNKTADIDSGSTLEGNFPTEEITYKTDSITYSSPEKEWYSDAECRSLKLTETDNPQIKFTDNTTLYKKWYYYTIDGTTQNTADQGFCMNPGNTVLYKYVRPTSVQDVVIPEGVKYIGEEAFSKNDEDLQNLQSIQLPSTLDHIDDDAFSFASTLDHDVYITAAADATHATEEARNLAALYPEHLKFKSASSGGSSGSDTSVTINVYCSINEIETISQPSIVKIPSGLSGGQYLLSFSDDDARDVIEKLLAEDSRTSALNQSEDVYFMDISFKKQNSENTVSFTGGMTIEMPIPSSWQSKNIEYFDVYCVSEDGKSLERLSDYIVTMNGKKAIGFTAEHFSEYALVYRAVDAGDSYSVIVNNGTGSGSYSAGSTVTITANSPASGSTFSGWTTSGTAITLSSTTSTTATFTMPAGSVTVTANYTTSGSSDSGNSESGSSDSGSSDSGSSGGGSSSSHHSSSSSSSGSSGSSGGGASSLDALAGLANGTTGAGITGAAGGSNGTGGSGATGGASSSGSASGGTHTKDSTPKTGDPLAYKTLIVCGCFSLGVLLLLTGNKKKQLQVS